MNDMQLEQTVKSLLVEACGSEQASTCWKVSCWIVWDLSLCWMDWRISASPFSQPRWIEMSFELWMGF